MNPRVVRVALAAPSHMQETQTRPATGTMGCHAQEPARWLTLTQAARHIGVAKSALYQWLQAGRVPHHRFGRLIKIHVDDLEQFVASARADGHWTPYGNHPQT
jgi:excisionase family DNA binding protein